MRDFSSGIKGVTKVILFCFVGLMLYMAYFSVFKGSPLRDNEGNPRILLKRNEVLRGTIYDKNGTPIAESERKDDNKQIRKYPYGEIYGAVVGYDSDQYEREGLEKNCDKDLVEYNSTGISGFTLKDYFADKNKEKIGHGVVTTLDTDLQKVAYDAMESQGFEGAAIVLEPKTGKILAMVTIPTYDANDVEKVMKLANSDDAPDKYLYNRNTEVTYPPGSVFKTLTMAVALENEPSVSERYFLDKGTIKFADGSTLSNFDFNANGRINLQLAYRLSSNYVFGTLGMEIPNYFFAEKAEEFGFNAPIRGIGLDAIASNFPRLDDELLGEKAQTGIGQGQVSVTPLEMAMVVSGIVNDGVLMKPKLIDKIVDENGEEIKTIKDEVFNENLVSENTTKVVKENMKALIDGAQNSPSYPTFAEFRGTNAGGKTGTADYWVDGKTLGVPYAWFVAAAPIDDPEIVVAVVCEEGHSGSGPSAAVAARIVNYYVNR